MTNIFLFWVLEINDNFGEKCLFNEKYFKIRSYSNYKMKTLFENVLSCFPEEILEITVNIFFINI